jgi:ATP-dependent DNA helicase RecG
LNRFGGNIFLGVEDNGAIYGIPKNSAYDIVKNFIKTICNPDIINPTIYLSPEIFEYKGCNIIRIHIPPSSEVHTYKKVIYDRIDDSDVKVSATGQIAQMYIRKQKIYTEKKIYPFVTERHIRLDLLPKVRRMAILRNDNHPWKDLSDEELLQSANEHKTVAILAYSAQYKVGQSKCTINLRNYL